MKRFTILAVPFLVACSGGSPASPTVQDASTSDAFLPTGEAGGGGADAPVESDAGGSEGGGEPVSVTFSYQPQWSGVTKVEVVGGFGLPSDWSKTESLVTLTASAGVYSGTASLAPGTYLYVLRVTGDAQAADPATYVRYSLDPLDTAWAACPAASPTYSSVDPNPCSQITVTSSGGPAPATAAQVKGSLTLGGAAAEGWMVVLEREEASSHHFFANRVTTGKDGSFDLVGSAGSYRLQVQYPTLLSATDLDRDPMKLLALRRAISAAFPLATATVTVPVPDLAFSAYDVYAPTVDGGTLPTAFTFEAGDEAKLDVYGGPGDGGVTTIGDPWFTSATANDGGAVFDGGFNTAQATEDAAAPGTRYMWGTEAPYGADASVAWTKQTMVFPITWH